MLALIKLCLGRILKWIFLIFQQYQFRKAPVPSDEEDLPSFVRKLMKYGVSLMSYSANLDLPEITYVPT